MVNKIRADSKQIATNYVLEKLAAAGIEVVTDKELFDETLADIEEINITLEMLNEKPNYLQKISSEINSEPKIGQDTTRVVSTPEIQKHITFISGCQELYLDRLIINKVTSIYGKDDEVGYVKNNIRHGNLVYFDKKRSLEWERECKVQFLAQVLPTEGFINNIL